MINIQNVQDFACQCLNRDVWSNDAVKTIIREHFIFWQVTFHGLLLFPSEIVSVSCTQFHCCHISSWKNLIYPLMEVSWNHFTSLMQNKRERSAVISLPRSHICVYSVLYKLVFIVFYINFFKFTWVDFIIYVLLTGIPRQRRRTKIHPVLQAEQVSLYFHP